MNIVFESLDDFLFERRVQSITNKIIEKKIWEFYSSLFTRKEFEKYKENWANNFKYWIDYWVKSNIDIKSTNDFIKIVLNDHKDERMIKTIKFIIDKVDGWGWYVSDLALNGHSIIEHKQRANLKKEDFIKFLNDEDYYYLDIRGVNTILIEIEPNYTQRVIEVPKYIYHVTPFYNLENIRKKGLIKREGSDRKYFERIYFTTDKKSAFEIMLALKLRDTDEMDIYTQENVLNGTESFSVIKIDTSKLIKGTKFYIDQHFGKGNKGIWTNSNIPKEAITIEDKIY
jgi:hypothetical protein